MIKNKMSSQVLTIAPDYKDYRGGIGAVVKTYSIYFNPFQFIHSYPSAKTKYKLGSFPVYLCACVKLFFTLFWNKKIRIVHIHVAAKGSFFRKYGIFLIVKYLFGRKSIFHSHGSELKVFYESGGRITKSLFHHYINTTDCIICLSPQWQSFYETYFSPRKIVVLENIVNRPTIELFTPRKSYLSFLFFGLIGNRKGIFDLIEVVKDHEKELRGNARFYIGGNGDVERLNNLIEQYGIQEIVEFVGWARGCQKNRLLSTCDVYLLPSYNEGLPISILEAMSYGKPVIATNVGGVPEVVKNGENGFLIKPGDKEALWMNIRYFLEQPARAKEMGLVSAEIVESYYPENVMKKLEWVYNELLCEQ